MNQCSTNIVFSSFFQGQTPRAHRVGNPVADPEGVHWVPWNPSFEGLPSKILCANVLTLELCTLAQ